MVPPNIIVALNAMSGFLIGILSFLIFLKRKRQRDPQVATYFLFIGASFVLLAYPDILKIIGISYPAYLGLGYGEARAVQTIVWSVLLTAAASRISGAGKRLQYFYLLLLASLLFIIPLDGIIVADWKIAASVLSYSALMVSFFTLFNSTSLRPNVRRAGMFGMFSSLLGLIYAVFSNTQNVLWFVPNVFLILAFSNLYRFSLNFGTSRPHLVLHFTKRVPESLIGKYAYLLFYIMAMSAVIFIATVSLHEIGHVLVGNYFGCTGGRGIIIDIKVPGAYAEMSCPEASPRGLIAAGSMLLVIPFAGAFFILRRFSERHFAWVILGIGFVTSGLDFAGITPALGYISAALGVLLCCVGEALIVEEYTTMGEETGNGA